MSIDKISFPAPPEVDRELYRTTLQEVSNAFSFRPLSREIGGYTNDRLNKNFERYLFPAPLEVDRYLYIKKNDKYHYH